MIQHWDYKLSLEWAQSLSWSRDVFKFWEITNNISEKGQERNIATMEDKWEIMYGLSNGMTANDLE